jgi:hypothetical protein
MLSKRLENHRNQLEVVALDQLVPDDHLVRKIKVAIDFDFIYPLVEEMYSLDNGRPSVDPSIAFIDSTHVKASANKKKFDKKVVRVETRSYHAQLDDESGYYVKDEREKSFA